MARIGPRDTAPEMKVRRILFARGWRYRLHAKGLPGTPDLVFPGRRKAIFVHGCFWHGHHCRRGRLPKTRLEFWTAKMEANKERDARKITGLAALGWGSIEVWQCELDDAARLVERVEAFLND